MGKFEKIIMVSAAALLIYFIVSLMRHDFEMQRQVYELKLMQKCQESFGKK